MVDQEWQDDWEELPPSKSARKREMTALQELGARLTQIPESQLKQIPIEDEQLLEAVMLARRITARGGLRRQLQYIGKLMRKIDAEPIIAAFARIDGLDQSEKARFHRLEQLREGLLQRGDEGIEAILDAFPDADRQQLRQWARQHAAEIKAGKAPSSARKVFRYLRELDESSTGAVLTDDAVDSGSASAETEGAAFDDDSGLD